eukprot:CAMPEP_0183515386 /NCGR_PEP_ID=MMETSP0371-20130417/13499_1 /TAXON_ID=268820 /ORGANISM="Peridinium aciculiferum, Strain PAER-2" /LENGTH=63 /DNA_ID=CAMNT_0025712955 /DNA_START=500 /DNA_END=691 /DNA_ORIENTATION=+
MLHLPSWGMPANLRRLTSSMSSSRFVSRFSEVIPTPPPGGMLTSEEWDLPWGPPSLPDLQGVP